MPLSLEKLRTILKKKGILPINFYIYKGSILFIKVLNLKYSNFFVIHVEPDYNFKIENNSFVENENIFYVKSVNISEFMSKQLGQDIRDIYSEIHFTPRINLNDDNLEKKLKDEYNQPIKIEDIKKDEGHGYIEAYKQIDRLKSSFSKVKYKIMISYDKYIFVLVDDKIKCYSIEDFEEGDYSTNFQITTSFKNFFEKIDDIDFEINQIKNKLEKILDYIQKNQYKRMTDLYSSKNDITSIYKDIYSRKENLVSIRSQYRERLDSTYTKEKELEKEYDKINKKISESGYQDNILHDKGIIEKSLSDIIGIRGEITEKLNKINNKINDFELTIDKIFYNNFIMMNNIRKNILILSELTK